MFSTDQAPGVYYQTVDAGSLPVTPLRTDIAAFVGIAERGPVDVPVPVESWQQFVSWFGGCTNVGYLAYAVRGFLANGGRRCWVVRVTSNDPLVGSLAASTQLVDSMGPVWRVCASSHGPWGDQLSLTVRERNASRAVTTADDVDGHWSDVATLSGFSRATLVRASQEGSSTVRHKVVSTADSARGRIYWMNPDAEQRLPYDGPLLGFDPDRPVLLETIEYQFLVSERSRLVRVIEGISLVPEHTRYGPRVLPADRSPIDPLTRRASATSPEPIILEELRSNLSEVTELVVNPSEAVRLTGGRAGLAALTVLDFVGSPSSADDSAAAIAQKRRGLRAVEDISEVSLLAVPDIQIRPIAANPSAPLPPCEPDPCLDEPVVEVGPAVEPVAELPPTFSIDDVFRVQSEMVLQCESKRDRFALLDPPFDVANDPAAGVRGVLDWRSRFETSYAALSHPWVEVEDPVGVAGSVRVIPPSGHVAGVMAATDLEWGVHKAPANRLLEWTLGATASITDGQHAVLNQHGVNVARTIGGRGLRLLGARTVSSDPDWQFVNVRRLMAMIEKALSIALEWAVFEPNGILTRARATMSVTFFLDSLHEAGMLAGSTPEESFFVKCDLDNNPAEQRDIGQLLIEVGVAPSQPFEFVVLRVGRVSDSIQVRGGSSSLGATGTEA